MVNEARQSSESHVHIQLWHVRMPRFTSDALAQVAHLYAYISGVANRGRFTQVGTRSTHETSYNMTPGRIPPIRRWRTWVPSDLIGAAIR